MLLISAIVGDRVSHKKLGIPPVSSNLDCAEAITLFEPSRVETSRTFDFWVISVRVFVKTPLSFESTVPTTFPFSEIFTLLFFFVLPLTMTVSVVIDELLSGVIISMVSPLPPVIGASQASTFIVTLISHLLGHQ